MAGRTDQGICVDLQDLVRLRAQASGFSFLPRQPVHSLLAGRHASRLRGRGLSFEELRRYVPGDDVRTIDWKVTARTRKPHVRVFTEERDRPVLLVVDQRRSMFFGSRRSMKSVAAAELAALAAWRTLAVGDRIGALVFDDRDVVAVPARRSQQQVLQILHTVAGKNRALRADLPFHPDPSIVGRVLDAALRIAKHDQLVCLIGDGAGTNPHTVEQVTRLSQHNDVLFAFIFDPLEARLPDVGRLVMAGNGLQLEVDSSNPRLTRAFASDFTDRLATLRRLSRERAMPFLPISTDGDVAGQIRSLLGRHAARVV